MSAFNQVFIGGFPGGGLVTDRKPFLLPNEAWSTLQNAYCFRERVKKRDGIKLVGRLQVTLTTQNPGNVSTSPTYSKNLLTTILITYPNAEIAPNSLTLTFGTGGSATTFSDNGQGGFTRTAGTTYQINTAIASSNVNYVTGAILLTFTTAPANGTVVSANYNYYPTLPSMGICKEDIATEGIDNTIYFDESRAYQYTNGAFQQFPGATTTTWTGDQTNFFWYCNYQGANPSIKTFFTTNNNITSGASTPYDPIRYYVSGAGDWATLQPYLTGNSAPGGATQLFQALILIPYYGRLLALNTWEGNAVNTSTNFASRCRFSQIGDPTVTGNPANTTGSWRSDVFGVGGFVDAPTNESIVSAAFFRNTLIVFFEYSTWQLRYIGEYGLPFIWERISSDFGGVSTFSSVVFDKGVLSVGNRGIIEAGAGGVKRIDEQIPEIVFNMQISSSASNTNNQTFVHGQRDFEKELVYWNYVDSTVVRPEVYKTGTVFPNTVLVYNYRNDTWATFRDNVTCFGSAQFSTGVTWDSLTALWDSSISWDSQDSQIDTNYIVSGNQHGFIHLYEYGGDNVDLSPVYPSILEYDPSLSVTAVNLAVSPIQITVNNHNLQDGEVIYLANLAWNGTDPGLSNMIYAVTFIDPNTLALLSWDAATNTYVNTSFTGSAPTYLGAGVLSLLPVVNMITKDFNPYQTVGKQFKMSYVDFLFDTSRENGITGFSIQLFVNTYMNQQSNIVVSNKDLLNSSPSKIITGVSQANPCVITSPDYSLPTGTEIYISNIVGMTELNAGFYIITVIDQNTFSLNGINSTGFTPYVSGGTWNQWDNPFMESESAYSDYAWYRFYSTAFGQYIRLGVTYDNILMNQLCTHQFGFELHGMNFWFKQGGRLTGP